jgi:hypothetical protein
MYGASLAPARSLTRDKLSVASFGVVSEFQGNLLKDVLENFSLVHLRFGETKWWSCTMPLPSPLCATSS